MVSIVVVTARGDIHAEAFRYELECSFGCRCQIFEVDTLPSGRLSWSNTSSPPQILDNRGAPIDLSATSAIWWRRFNAFPQHGIGELNAAELDLVRNDTRAAVLGTFLTSFTGAWVNHPVMNSRAENKLLQLAAAQKIGLKVPKTLVSNDPAAIKNFSGSLDGKVIIKPVRGTQMFPLQTKRLSEAHVADPENVRLCPAIFQEEIDGSEHLRIHCFGSKSHAISIVSSHLDWRVQLNVPFAERSISDHLQSRLIALLAELGLRMGIVDLKIDLTGEPVFLEINPQGQFLFSEGLSGAKLMNEFARFMMGEIQQSK